MAGVAALGLVALGGCGARPATSGSGGGSDSSAPATSGASGSSGDAACSTMVKAGQEASVDLDGDGSVDHVTYRTEQGGGCPAGLVANVDGKQALARTHDVVPTAMRAVSVPGRSGQILVVTQNHPRGGEQQRLFAYADGRLAELRVEGNPVLPFVATDTPPLPTDGFAAVCTQGGIGVQRVVAHTPVGIAPAFDIVQTDYRIDGTTLTESGSQKVKDNVLDDQLTSQAAALVKHEVLTEGCG